uniref:Uncharacterized protein n=1 Tax=Chromera velia CCMP2878 TaxID=1169474 RepID=A0A0G4FF87_9ALVE|eukprot:Cvel_16670.t1-p1 / transcript=Cvel_16670.t1 / gene=Cvel_16670 / organism=Chromera_velia_CCMP2878 / gene_product=50S ribosomal protein L20, putative / transcript_product=50S ribosomal protein L20, putative / location=Cvel_scaffold1294:4646-6340(-) / protein_length=88 / sequence_SO=supercontig / SO=protein_coding / is_pseudo=false
MRQDFYTRLKRKRRFRVYWMSKINIASREWNLTYAHLTCGLRHANIWIDRKNLCTLAETEPVSFKALVDEAKRLYYVQASKPRNIEDL